MKDVSKWLFGQQLLQLARLQGLLSQHCSDLSFEKLHHPLFRRINEL